MVLLLGLWICCQGCDGGVVRAVVVLWGCGYVVRTVVVLSGLWLCCQDCGSVVRAVVMLSGLW